MIAIDDVYGPKAGKSKHLFCIEQMLFVSIVLNH